MNTGRTINCFSLEIFILLFISGYANSFTTIATTLSHQRATITRIDPLNAYVPDGLSVEEYNRIKKAEANKLAGKDLGRLGPRGFQSRSMQAWQEAYEKGETGHAFAPFGYRERLKKGQLTKKDVPYMVRGGSWDNSDVLGAKRVRWLKTDKEYARGGYKKEQSASILGSGPGFDWTGRRVRDDDKTRRVIPGLS